MRPEPEVEMPEAMPEGKEPVPRGTRIMSIVRWVLVVGTGLLALGMWFSLAKAQLTPKPSTSQQAPKYQCPMHPQIVSNDPGECPICHMDLELVAPTRSAIVDAGTGPLPEHHHESPAGSRKKSKVLDGGASLPPGSTPPETVPVKLSFDRIQTIGVRTAVASMRASKDKLRVTASVMASEQGTAEVHARAAGFVEAMHVDQTGVKVHAGQPMLSLYSPDLLVAQTELVTTKSWTDAGTTSVAARHRLELLGMQANEIERVLSKGEPVRAITLVSPRKGIVTKKNVVLGAYVTPETILYEIQDLSNLYVVADIFSSDIENIGLGTEGRFAPSNHEERGRVVKVDLVYPSVSLDARTHRVRMQVRNEGSDPLAPGEYGTVEFSVASSEHVTIPRDALIDTGTTTYVFVVDEEGRFVPRVVAIRASDANSVAVDAGIKAGERVVSGATFLIDSESRLQASIANAAQESGEKE